MDIRGMHYDLKQKLNKIDSQQYRNLKVPEIDWKLNEALKLMIKLIAEPKYRTNLGFEVNQRVIDDIRTIVVNSKPLTITAYDSTSKVAAIPTDYDYYISTDKLIMIRGKCSIPAEKVYVRQHDDDFEISSFDKSSFEWREVNLTFFENGIRVHTEGEFEVSEMNLNYIKKHPWIHNAQDYIGGTYNLPDGTVLTGSQNCILPEHLHSEIVDLAVLIITIDLQLPDFQTKRAKLNLNQI